MRRRRRRSVEDHNTGMSVCQRGMGLVIRAAAAAATKVRDDDDDDDAAPSYPDALQWRSIFVGGDVDTDSLGRH
jgi:hypothetical protein